MNDTHIPLPLEGASAAALAARAALEALTATRTPVLLAAEAGCRPEAVARALHDRSRPQEPFVAIDCGVDDPLGIEVRIFGGVARDGEARELEVAGPAAAILLAGAGTLFLDHVDELPASVQRRLARVLRDGEVLLDLEGQTAAVAFRLITATARDLDVEVREGRFREDLLRRLAAARLRVPAASPPDGFTASLREAKRQFERDYIAAVLERHRWSMREAARTLGIERANLYRKTRQLGITRGRESSLVQR